MTGIRGLRPCDLMAKTKRSAQRLGLEKRFAELGAELRRSPRDFKLRLDYRRVGRLLTDLIIAEDAEQRSNAATEQRKNAR